MTVKLHGIKHIYIKSEYIKLDSLLKLACFASTGGEAKIYILGGDVFVNGELCVSRGKKIRHGDIVRFGRNILLVKKTA